MARIVGPRTTDDTVRGAAARRVRRSDVTRELPRIDATRPDPGSSVVRPGAVVTEDATAPCGILIDPSGAWPAPDVSTQMERPMLVSRQCSRTGCAEPAAVTLMYNYARQQVWIDVLLPERDPHRYDLCERHADRLSVPHGWHLDDRRHQRDGVATPLIAV
ncbi:MAG: DUF3499 family protein [Actinomycetota bacterium]